MKSALFLSDFQLPYEDKRSVRAVEKYMADGGEWDYVILGGDFVDLDCISSHNINNLRAVEGKTIQADYDYANKVLDRLQQLAPNAKFVLIEGNHEFRIERFLDANPTLRGSIEIEKGLKLRERGIQWVRNWSQGEVYRIGKAVFIHGLYGNDHHAKKTVQAYNENVFYGDMHDVQGYSLVRQGDNNTVVGQSLGCLCSYNQTYIHGKPTRWQQAFGVFYFFPNGNFTYYVPRIFEHRFVGPNGKVYAG